MVDIAPPAPRAGIEAHRPVVFDLRAEVQRRLAESPQAVVFLGAQDGSAGLYRPPQKLSSLTAAIQQQAQQRRFAGLLRSGKQCDCLLRDDPFPDPGDRLREGLQPFVAIADGGFLVDGHKSSSWKKKGQPGSPNKFERSRPLHASCSVCVWRSAIHYLYICILFLGPRVGKSGKA
jgi:hypothetical protein